jgi:tRNA(fMet)-specific endonuclease VapC
MIYLLDTCILSLFARGSQPVLTHVKRTPPEAIGLSAVTIMEVAYGLALNPARAVRLRPVLDAFIGAVKVIDYDSDAAHETASLRAALRAKGKPIGPFDTMIAGTALARGLVMVTANTGEFRRMDGLTLEDWSSEA